MCAEYRDGCGGCNDGCVKVNVLPEAIADGETNVQLLDANGEAFCAEAGDEVCVKGGEYVQSLIECGYVELSTEKAKTKTEETPKA